MTPEERDKTFVELLSAWQKEDFPKCKGLIVTLCENMEWYKLAKIFCSTFDAAIAAFSLFCNAGLHKTEPESSVLTVFAAIVGYIIKNRTPELDAAMAKMVEIEDPDLKPMGYDENGNNVYDADDFARSLGLTEEGLREGMQEILNMSNFGAPEGLTIH